MKEDRRVRYTRQALTAALVQLMQEKHISKISVKALCELADVNRSTFYAHFSDQFDLLYFVQREVIDSLKAYLGSRNFEGDAETSVQSLYNILEYAKNNAELFKVLLGENGDSTFHQELMQLPQMVDMNALNPRSGHIDERSLEYMYIFCVTGCVSMLHKWLEGGTVEPTQQMAEFVLKLLGGGIINYK